MTTSGSYDFTATRDQIINRALRIIGVVPQGETATAEQVKETAESLNAMVKSWQNEHIHLWLTEWVTKTFTASSQVLGTDGKNYTCIRSHTSAASNRPITGADYTTYWIEAGSTGAVWGLGVDYSSIGDFLTADDTLDILSAFIRDGGNDWPMSVLPMHEFLSIWQKDRTGRPFTLSIHKELPAGVVGGRTVTSSSTGYPLVQSFDTVTLLSAVSSASGAGSVYTLPSVMSNFSVVVTLGGSPTSATAIFQGSIDNATWADLYTFDSISTDTAVHVAFKPVKYIRGNCGTINGGVTPTLTMKALGGAW